MPPSVTQKFGHIDIPLKRVHIELTNRCEFDCKFCPKSMMTRPYGAMDTGMVKHVITDLGKHQICEKITFHVMGEPTLHRDFFEILDHANSEGVKVGLTTNGASLGRSIGQKLVDYDLHQIDVSFQTPDEDSFVLRKAGKLTFSAYQKGVLNFFKAYQPHHPDTIFKFRFMNMRFGKKLVEQLGDVEGIASTTDLRETFQFWANWVYDILEVDDGNRQEALKKIGKLASYKWNVVEIYPNVFFETYMLANWGHSFDKDGVHDAWAGTCFGMQDHFAILYNGDVILCCIDYDGKTAIGNLNEHSLEDILSSDELGDIIRGFKSYRLVHPYCKHCLGSKSWFSWLIKPIGSALALRILKPFFYHQTRVFKE